MAPTTMDRQSTRSLFSEQGLERIDRRYRPMLESREELERFTQPAVRPCRPQRRAAGPLAKNADFM